MLAPWKKSYNQPRQHIKKQRYHFAHKCPSSQSYGFSVVMYGWESWTIKKAEQWRIDAFELWLLEKTLESPLDFKEIQPVHPKGDKSWIFFVRSDIEAETRIFWPTDVKNWLIWKDLNAGKDWEQEEKGTTGWDGWMASPTQWTWFGWTLGVGDGQGGLACYGSWGRKESDMTEQLNWSRKWHVATHAWR